MLPLYLSNLHSLTWKMFQISGKAPTYVKTYLYSSSVCKWDGKASRSFSFKHLCHLCMEKWWAIGLSRYHSGNWVTSHTMCYINITGGDSYKEKYKRRAAFRAALAIFRHAQCIFSKKQFKKKIKYTTIHPCKQSRHKKEKSTKEDTKWWSGIEVENSYQALNPKRRGKLTVFSFKLLLPPP